MCHLSVVVPVFMAEGCLIELCCRLTSSLGLITNNYEVILVEDGGQDNSWITITKLAAQDSRIKGLKLSRNFGQHHAITAGLDASDGDWVVVMDCDLQDQPEEIIKLYQKVQHGYQVVMAIRGERQENEFKVMCGKMFHRLLTYLTNTEWDHQIGTFRIMSRKVVVSLGKMREHDRFFNGMVNWLGYPTSKVTVQHATRFEGESSYNLFKLIKLAAGALISFSEKPLKLSILLGALISAGGFIYGILILCRKIMLGIPVEGWTSIIVSLYFLSGLILLNLGIVGLYIGRIFVETKNRPIYVIDERV